MNTKPLILSLILAVCTFAQAPVSGPKLAVLTTNEVGELVYVPKTNAPTPPTTTLSSPFLTPAESSKALVSLLDSHMEAVRRGWTNPEESASQYRWLEQRLIEVIFYAPMSDMERELARIEERRLREEIRLRDVTIANLRSDRIRLQVEIQRLRGQTSTSTPPAK